MYFLPPRISVKVDVSPREFIDRFCLIAANADDLIVEKVEDFQGFEGFGSLNIRLKSNGQTEDIGGQVIASPDDEARVAIEVIASRWNGDITHDLYIQFARNLFGPLIQRYNIKHNTKLRLYIQPTKRNAEPKLPPKAKQLFERFVRLANKRALHPLDWKRFYGFVRFCHAYHIKLQDSSLSRLLVLSGFSEKEAHYLADLYRHQREILGIGLNSV